MRQVTVADDPPVEFKSMYYHLANAVTHLVGHDGEATLYRGDDIQKHAADLGISDSDSGQFRREPFMWHDFKSTSTDRDVSLDDFAKGLLFEITGIAPTDNLGVSFVKAKRAGDLNLSRYPKENEILLPPGVTFQIIGRRKEGDVHVVQLEYKGLYAARSMGEYADAIACTEDDLRYFQAQLELEPEPEPEVAEAAQRAAKSREAIQSELAHMLSVAKQLRENGQALEQAAAEEQAQWQAAAQQTAAPVAALAPPTKAPAGYDDIQSELEALQVEADEFNGELEGLRQSLGDVESSSGQESPNANAGGRGDHIGVLSGLRLTRSRRNLTERCATARPALATVGHPTRAFQLLSELTPSPRRF
jgi:hypothetical protein